MADHGTRQTDLRQHEKTFAGFVHFVMWSVVLIVGVLFFLALVNA